MTGGDPSTRDPVLDSRAIRKELSPIVQRLRQLLTDLERIADQNDHDNEGGRRGD